jgi:hypothetical protein
MLGRRPSALSNRGTERVSVTAVMNNVGSFFFLYSFHYYGFFVPLFRFPSVVQK